MATKILITGASGLVGTKISYSLQERGYEVSHLSRSVNGKSDFPVFKWNPEKKEVDEAALDVDYIIHLAGAGIADKRWTTSRKKLIYDSRIGTTDLLLDEIRSRGVKLKGFVCASAIGYYGMDSGQEEVTEESNKGNDFLSEVVQDWELAADRFSELNIPVTKIRLGIVLSSKGGALPKILKPIKMGVGAALGSGKQILSWIHISDLCDAIIHLMEHKHSGTFNLVAPNPVTNEEITAVAAKKLRRGLVFPNVPGFILRIIFGKMAGILLGGNNVSARKILDLDFEFQYNTIQKALTDLIPPK